MRKKPHCSKRLIIAQSRLFKIEQMALRFENGAERVYERIIHNGHGAVLVVPLTASGAVYLVEEYAAGTDGYEWTFPKGLIEPDETALQAALRELREETGFGAQRLTWLRTLRIAPGYFKTRLEVVIAEDLYTSPLQGDEPEPPHVVEWPLESSQTLLQSPVFSEASSIAALLLVKEWLNTGKKYE